jgi:iron complex outermembrane receptor protein
MKGNNNLNPEYSWQVDLGWDYTSSIFSIQLSGFANFIDNYIFAHKLLGVITDNCETYQYTQGNARLLGGEASFDIHPISKLHFQNDFSYVNSVQLHQPRESKYLPYTPAPRWKSEIRYDIIEDGKHLHNAYFSAVMDCNLRQNHYYAAQETETATPSYTLFDLTAGADLMSKGHKLASLYLSVNNIFDRAYVNHLNRLKYVGNGIYNMGRNIGIKVIIPLILSATK